MTNPLTPLEQRFLFVATKLNNHVDSGSAWRDKQKRLSADQDQLRAQNPAAANALNEIHASLEKLVRQSQGLSTLSIETRPVAEMKAIRWEQQHQIETLSIQLGIATETIKNWAPQWTASQLEYLERVRDVVGPVIKERMQNVERYATLISEIENAPQSGDSQANIQLRYGSLQATQSRSSSFESERASPSPAQPKSTYPPGFLEGLSSIQGPPPPLDHAGVPPKVLKKLHQRPSPSPAQSRAQSQSRGQSQSKFEVIEECYEEHKRIHLTPVVSKPTTKKAVAEPRLSIHSAINRLGRMLTALSPTISALRCTPLNSNFRRTLKLKNILASSKLHSFAS